MGGISKSVTGRLICRQLIILAALTTIGLGALYTGVGRAEALQNRSVRLLSSVPSINTTHVFQFDIISPSNLGSIEFEYCTNNPFVGTACTAPGGLDVSLANLNSESGETGFVVDPSSTANRLILSRPPAVAAPQSASYTLGNVVNPSSPAQTVYVRISTFASSDASGARIDTGAVVFATAAGLLVDGFVPPYLTFCAGINVALDCSTTTGNKILFGELSATETKHQTSQFAGATNDESGYTASVSGTTMTSGNNIITANASPVSSQPGASQFGINLRANSVPSVGQEPIGSGSAAVMAGYDSPNQFMYKNDTLVSSTISTDFNRFTVSYVINVSSDQPPGLYATTLTYIAVASF
jgi:hypothetical protein